MKTHRQCLAAACAAVIALAVAPIASGQASTNSIVYPPTAHPYGMSYAQWSAQWWRWALAQPVAGHPFTDPGFDCNSAQNGQSGPVWFLATSAIPTLPSNPSLPPDLSALVVRSCTVPAHTPILLGLEINECSSLEGYPTKASQQACAKGFADLIVQSALVCVVDGQAIADLEDFRFVSPQFTFQAPTPWIFGPTGGTGTGVSDGYFVMLKPLSPGTHTLSCGGRFYDAASGLNIGFGNTYHLTVTGENSLGVRPGDRVGARAGDLK
jgi:hypothetical protein